MTGMMSIGTNALVAAEVAMDITAQNIANANTPFYCRRQVAFTEAFYNGSGNGISVSGIQRIYNSLAMQNVQTTTGDLSRSQIYLDRSQYLETLLTDNGNGIESNFNVLTDALNIVNARPSSEGARQSLMLQVSNLASVFNSLGSALSDEQAQINAGLRVDVLAVNQTTAALATLNQTITSASGNDLATLLDQRDQLMNVLSKYIGGLQTSDNGGGAVDVTLSDGTPLVQGTQTNQLSLVASSSVAGQFDISITYKYSGTTADITNDISAGEMGGLLNYQNTVLSSSGNTLSRLALVFAQEMNSQNGLGLDLYGDVGGDIFDDYNATSNMVNRAYNNTTNQGSYASSVRIDDATQLTSSNYKLEFVTPSTYQLTRASDLSVVASGSVSGFPLNISADGFTVTVASGTNMTAGDAVTIMPTLNHSATLNMNLTDPTRLAFAWPVAVSAPSSNNGTGQIALTNVLDQSAFGSGALIPPYQIVFTSATTYNLVDTSSSSVVASGVAYDPVAGSNVFPVVSGSIDPGYRVFLSGTMQSGDTFNINYNSGGVLGDNSNGLAFSGLLTKGVLDDSTLDFSEAYRELFVDLSLQVNAAKSSFETNSTLKRQAETVQDQLSGVSLPEESVNLTRYEHAYQASAQVVEVSQRTFDILIKMLRS
jgi:flagellar hook-associated protein 1 FlgK